MATSSYLRYHIWCLPRHLMGSPGEVVVIRVQVMKHHAVRMLQSIAPDLAEKLFRRMTPPR